MRLVLHVGMAKSGSTAIQRGLQQLHDPLLAAGYLYPKGLQTSHNQSSLIVAAVPPEKLPRYFLPRYEGQPDRIAHDFAQWIDGIRAAAERHRPKALLMSGETLFELARPEQFEKLAAVLRSLADTIEIVAYLRRPSDFYFASVQQILRADHRVRPLAPVAYRAPLEGFAAIADRLHVFKYDRALFPGGDALRHFVERFCPEMAEGSCRRSPPTSRSAPRRSRCSPPTAGCTTPTSRAGSPTMPPCCRPRSPRPTARCPPAAGGG